MNLYSRATLPSASAAAGRQGAGGGSKGGLQAPTQRSSEAEVLEHYHRKKEDRKYWVTAGVVDSRNLYEVAKGTAEFNDISGMFSRSCPKEIVQLERVENAPMHDAYIQTANNLRTQIGQAFDAEVCFALAQNR
jgi:hypothetical protein